MKSLYYSVVEVNAMNALLVLNELGSLVYASLGKSPVELKQIMVKDFKAIKTYHLKSMSLLANKTKTDATIQKFQRLLEDPKTEQDIPIEIIFGTPLQQKVWKELIKIKPGETKTYKQLADSIGTHSRVVGNCCGANRIAVVIPCHRVLGSTGKLTGYRWGTKVKDFLLNAEK